MAFVFDSLCCGNAEDVLLSDRSSQERESGRGQTLKGGVAGASGDHCVDDFAQPNGAENSITFGDAPGLPAVPDAQAHGSDGVFLAQAPGDSEPVVIDELLEDACHNNEISQEQDRQISAESMQELIDGSASNSEELLVQSIDEEMADTAVFQENVDAAHEAKHADASPELQAGTAESLDDACSSPHENSTHSDAAAEASIYDKYPEEAVNWVKYEIMAVLLAMEKEPGRAGAVNSPSSPAIERDTACPMALMQECTRLYVEYVVSAYASHSEGISDAEVIPAIESEIIQPNGYYLPDATDTKPLLVLDLDHTLICPTTPGECERDDVVELELASGVRRIKILRRPFLAEFLASVGPFYEIAVFSAGLEQYCTKIVALIDGGRHIKHVFDRRHCMELEGCGESAVYAKPLDLIGRDTAKMILVDDLADSFSFNPANGQLIPSYSGEPNDRALLYLRDYLLRNSCCPDFRTLERLMYPAPE
ncbi:hypothetical protein PAPHI01_1167 [Pancytospora philotis]|nr:hypothetical protein PAPHI01_1167 [Pancytospora philotis]